MLSDYSSWRVLELGLGRGVDGTAQNPCNRASSYQVREAKEDKSNLICMDKGCSLTSFIRDVTSIQEQQVKLTGTITAPNPSASVSVDMGVDAFRGIRVNRKSVGKRIDTKTIAFKPSFGDKEEEKLARDILLHANIPYDQSKGNSCVEILLSTASSSHFNEFVEDHRITHYVSSITLGASSFIVTNESELKKQVSTRTKAGYQSIAQAGVSTSFTDKLMKKNENVQNVGKLSEDGESVEVEAVIEAQLLPISRLIQTKEFKRRFQAAVARFVKDQQDNQGKLELSVVDVCKVLCSICDMDSYTV